MTFLFAGALNFVNALWEIKSSQSDHHGNENFINDFCLNEEILVKKLMCK